MQQTIYLRKFEKTDLTFIHKLRNDANSYRLTLGNKYFISMVENEEWLTQKMNKSSDDLYLVICLQETNEPIGFMSANQIDLINRKAEFGGMVLTKSYTGMGYGEKAGELMLEYLFGEKGIRLVYGFVKEDNSASQRLADQLNFNKTGFIPEFIYKDFTYYGVYIYALTRDAYLKIHNEKRTKEVFMI